MHRNRNVYRDFVRTVNAIVNERVDDLENVDAIEEVIEEVNDPTIEQWTYAEFGEMAPEE